VKLLGRAGSAKYPPKQNERHERKEAREHVSTKLRVIILHSFFIGQVISFSLNYGRICNILADDFHFSVVEIHIEKSDIMTSYFYFNNGVNMKYLHSTALSTYSLKYCLFRMKNLMRGVHLRTHKLFIGKFFIIYKFVWFS
jgi:hypothetical protein